MDSIRRGVFLMQSCHFFELLTRFIHKMTFLVAMCAVRRCVEMPESVFVFNVRSFGVILAICSVKLSVGLTL